MDNEEIRILLVEDNPGDALLVSEALFAEEPAPFKLFHTDCLASGLARLGEGGIDLILLDLSLPDSHGLGTFHAMHARADLVPIIVLSGMDDEALALKAVGIGAQDYLVKGQASSDLLARSVRYALGRSRAESELRKSESAMRAFQDTSPMMMGIVEVLEDDVLFVSLNAMTARLRAASVETMRGQRASQLGISLENIRNWILQYRESEATGRPVQFESLEELSLGLRWISFTVCHIAGGPAGRSRFSYVGEDVTEGRRAKEVLRLSEERFARAVRGSSDGLWDWLCSTDQVYYSPQFKSLLGYEDHEFPDLLLSWQCRLHPDDEARIMEALRAHVEERAPYEVEYRLLTKSGEYRWFRARGEGTWDEALRPLRMAGSITDITERKRREGENRELTAQLQCRLEQTAALRQIDMAINSSFDLDATLNVVIDQVFSQLRADAADILLVVPHSRSLKFAAGKGFQTRAMERTRLDIDDSVSGQIVQNLRPLHLSDLSSSPRPFARAGAMAEEGFRAYSAVPLVSKGICLGVIEVFRRAPLEADPNDNEFLTALADQAAIAIENASLFEGLQRSNRELTLAYDATIEGWSKALDLRDKETDGHSQRVTQMTLRLARAFGFGEGAMTNIRRGALLHDIGKLGIPDAILLKPGPLDESEIEIMRRHTIYAYEWLSPIAFLRPAIEIPHCHHERWDGTGYPRGLKREQIPLVARMFAAVDICDALCSDRPYRNGWPIEKVCEHLRSLSGTHLDPRVVDVFVPMIEQPDWQEPASSVRQDAAQEAVEARINAALPGAAFAALLKHSGDFVLVLDGSQ